MNLENKQLDDWLLTCRDYGAFPYSFDYPSKYRTISNDLNTWIHDNVNAGAQSVDGTFLTNHGVNHIKTLIDRATKFVDGNDFCILTPFEVYILLLAIHIHDVGNIFGRKGHELNAAKIADLIGTGIVGQDRVIWEYILDIAMAHKGEEIEQLPQEDYVNEKPIRVQLLAAIVKFADELSENTLRADLAAIALNTIPPESKLFHYYAKSLDSVIPLHKTREIIMIFFLEEDILSEQFLKIGSDGESNIYLIDEIYLRTMKTYLERVYCSRFLRPYINFDSVKVSIKIKLNNGKKVVNGYELCESGLMKVHMEEVFRICPDLQEFTGIKYHEKSRTNAL